ncbi:hypothetical protein CYMTET_11064 [Cymbomonas tetramitiformis]|uniref:Uncharacterized protein n=1 Tax=Cymbomonas tetramitiformis TaxID=36881 RepID=A0AAE0GMX1_9CHLO|nr:hypothetical protein CYMTET_11064 [Cymbomonas tetramitiformis]
MLQDLLRREILKPAVPKVENGLQSARSPPRCCESSALMNFSQLLEQLIPSQKRPPSPSVGPLPVPFCPHALTTGGDLLRLVKEGLQEHRKYAGACRIIARRMRYEEGVGAGARIVLQAPRTRFPCALIPSGQVENQHERARRASASTSGGDDEGLVSLLGEDADNITVKLLMDLLEWNIEGNSMTQQSYDNLLNDSDDARTRNAPDEGGRYCTAVDGSERPVHPGHPKLGSRHTFAIEEMTQLEKWAWANTEQAISLKEEFVKFKRRNGKM